MGLFDGTSAVGSTRSYSYQGRTAHSPSARSTRSSGGYYTRPSHTRSSASFFGSSSSRNNGGGWGGSSSFFGGSSSKSGSSYYKRRPRDGYIQYLLHRLQRMIKELWYYARKHPVKAFFAVVVPLISAGGALSGLLSQFGIRLPMGLAGGSSAGFGGSSFGGSSGLGGLFGSGGGSGGWMDNAGSLLSIARAFT
ncbi:hypothetical protein MBLNU230_g5911t1 [Neophaeotheca triangularis]